MRRWLYPDAKMTGYRSFVAGLFAPSVWFIWGGLGLRVSEVVAWSMFPLLGLVLAVVMFVAWLTPTPEEMRRDSRGSRRRSRITDPLIVRGEAPSLYRMVRAPGRVGER